MTTSPENPFSLTDRERDVLACMAEGMTNKEIAAKLVISTGTVHWYTKQIYSKMNVNSRTQASLLARETGMLEDEPSADTPLAKSALPDYTLPFVGRKKETQYIHDLIAQKQARLITITGHGGTGKTRLAVEMARQLSKDFSDGVVFIPFADLKAPHEQFQHILRRYLSLPASDDPQYLYDSIAQKRYLLLLDNFEHFIDERDAIAALLQQTQHVCVIITSQLALQLRQEWLVPLSGLNISGDNHEAIHLFTSCVQRIDPNFNIERHQACAHALCDLVNGIPLAIELAATWLQTLSCEDAQTEIQVNLDMLSTSAPDVPERHRSLQAVFDYAWELLTDDEQRVLRRLAVFRGDFGLLAAKQVADASIQTLSNLVNRSLIQKTPDDAYRMHSLLRQYAEDKLRVRQVHGKHSKVALAMLSLIKGEFDKVEHLAQELMTNSADDVNLDKGFGLAILGVIAGANEKYTDCLQLCGSSLRTTQEAPIALLFSYLGLSIGYCGKQDYISARTTIRYAIDNAQKLHTSALLLLCLPVIALLLYDDGHAQKSTEILSLVHHSAHNLPQWLHDWQPMSQLQQDLQTAHAGDDFEQWWDAGKNLEIMTVIQDLDRLM